jgi:hypothetical protein
MSLPFPSGTDITSNAFPFNSRMVRVDPRPKGEHHVEESRAYLRSCCKCHSVLRNAHIAQAFGVWCLLIRQKPTMATIDASLDELTGATIIIATAIISTT